MAAVIWLSGRGCVIVVGNSRLIGNIFIVVSVSISVFIY